MDVPAEAIFTIFPSSQTANKPEFRNIATCYVWWANLHLSKHEEQHHSILRGSKSTGNKIDSTASQRWMAVAQELKSGYNSLGDILDALVEVQLLEPEALMECRSDGLTFVHGLVGLQTMLFTPLKSSLNPEYLQINEELRGFSGQAVMETVQDASSSNKPVHKYLLNFGMMLPPRKFDLFDTDSDMETGKLCSMDICPDMLNAKLLAAIGRVTIKWTDSLACHMEFNESSRELHLFRYPSFCINSWTNEPKSLDSRASIHGCSKDEAALADWATAQEVSMLMKEILLSYRLLFGQRSDSRKYFTKQKPWGGIPNQGQDKMLHVLCSQKHVKELQIYEEKEHYDLYYDFPMLYGKLRRLHNFIDNIRPRTVKEVWQDRRDNSAWLTLWVVLIFGGVGILLALMQVILQIIQLCMQK